MTPTPAARSAPTTRCGHRLPIGAAGSAALASGRLGACALIAWMGCAAVAAPPALPDPTRPPSFEAQAAVAGSAAYGLRHPLQLSASRRAQAASAPAVPAPLPQVQSVRLPRQGAPSALVDGRLLQVGDRLAGPWGERTISAIDEQGLLLQAQPKDRSVLRLWLLGATATQAKGIAPGPNDTVSPTPSAKLAGRSPP